jgi:outer membrane immunogenic protein
MKKILLATAALAALVSAPAMAADLAVKAPVYKAPPPVYAFSWTGCYVGGNVGGLWARKEWSNTTFPGSGTSFDADSWLGGVQVGCNYQFAGGWVIGIQGDYDWSDAKGSGNDLFFAETDRTKIKSLASVTGRIGYSWDRFLGYVKGGVAWERDDHTVYDNTTGFLVGSASATRSGWTVGVGGEYAFTDWLSGFVEYDYYDFGTSGTTLTTPGGFFLSNVDIKETKSVAKVGLNIRFGPGPGPVVAKY